MTSNPFKHRVLVVNLFLPQAPIQGPPDLNQYDEQLFNNTTSVVDASEIANESTTKSSTASRPRTPSEPNIGTLALTTPPSRTPDASRLGVRDFKKPPSIVEDLQAVQNRTTPTTQSQADTPEVILPSLSNPFSSTSSPQILSRTSSNSSHSAIAKPGFGSRLTTLPPPSSSQSKSSSQITSPGEHFRSTSELPIITGPPPSSSSPASPAPSAPPLPSAPAPNSSSTVTTSTPTTSTFLRTGDPSSPTSQSIPPFPRKGSTRRRSSNNNNNNYERRNSFNSTTSQSSPRSSIPVYHFHNYPHGNGGLQNAFSSCQDWVDKTLWIGAPGVPMDDWNQHARLDLLKRYRNEHSSKPVIMSDHTMEVAYNVFCKGYLWGAMHYQLPEDKRSVLFEGDTYAAYVALNQAFADAIIEEYEEGDMIMINDYHLMLVPQMIREKLKDAPIGFFLHIAFPSSEVFRCLPMRRDLLLGILGADLIGLQTYNFSRHFRINVSRILSYESNPRGVYLPDGRFVHLNVFPIGINVTALEEKLEEPEVEQWVSILSEKYKGYKVLVGRDKLDSIKGVRQKLLAFERFLEQHSEYQGKVVLIQVALATAGENEQQTKVNDVVQRINSRFSRLAYQPVVFIHQDVTFGQYLALLKIADAFLAFPVREGMNLTSHEYVIAQRDSYHPLILSEFAGTYSYSGFRSCLAINPWDIGGSSDAIYQALTMPRMEAHNRWKELESHVLYQTAQQWVQSFIMKLERVSLEHYQDKRKVLPRFNIEISKPDYENSNKRLIFIDLEHTLVKVDDQHGEPGIELSNEAIKMLQQVHSDKKNQVYVISDQATHEMERILSKIPGIGKVAENGCWLQHPKNKEWMCLVQESNMDWRQHVLETLRYYSIRTPRSFVEDRGITICWHFWHGDETGVELDWARRMSAEVQNHIMDSVGEKFSLYIHSGAKSFLVTLKNASRASAVWRIVQQNRVGAITPSTEQQKQSLMFSPIGSPTNNPRGGDGTPLADQDTEKGPAKGELSSLIVKRLAETAKKHQFSFDSVLCVGQDDPTFSLLKGLETVKCVSISVDGDRRDADWYIPDSKTAISELFALTSSSSLSSSASNNDS